MSAAVRRSFASLHIRNYRIYFAGQLASVAGNWMQIVAELWLILSLTGSGTAVGLATALQFGGILLLGPLGGALADRVDKRRLLIATNLVMVLPPLALFAVTLGGPAPLWFVYAAIGVRGFVLAVDNPARQAFVIEIVGSERVVNAVGLNSLLIHSARIIGPAVAGGAIALAGVALPFLLNALTFVAMVAALLAMRPGELATREIPAAPPRVREAVAYVRARPELARPLALMAVLGTLGFNFQTIVPLLARFSFEGEVYAYTALMMAMGAGAIAGSLALGSWGRPAAEVTALAAMAFGIAALAGAAAPTLALEMAALALLGAAAVTFAAIINSGLQLAASPAMRGRVMALYGVVFLGSTPIGGPLAGWVAEAVSPRASLALAGAAALGVAVVARPRTRVGCEREGATGEERVCAVAR